MPKRKRDRRTSPVSDVTQTPSSHPETSAAQETAPSFSSAPAPKERAAKAVDPAVAEAVALFAQRERAGREAERQAKREKRANAERETELQRLRQVKAEAVAHLKSVRRQERIAPGEAEAAEAAYTSAAADVVAMETGQRPSWAPIPFEPPEVSEVSDPEPSDDDLAPIEAASQPDEPSEPVGP